METQIELDTLLAYLRQELERIDQKIITLERMALTPCAQIGVRPPVRIAEGRSVRVGARKAWSTHRIRRD